MEIRTPAPNIAPTPLAEARGSYAQCFRRIALVVEFLEIVSWIFNSCIRCSSHAVSLVKFPFQLCFGHWQKHPTAKIKRKKTALYILFKYKLISCHESFNVCSVYTIYNVIFALCFLFSLYYTFKSQISRIRRPDLIMCKIIILINTEIKIDLISPKVFKLLTTMTKEAKKPVYIQYLYVYSFNDIIPLQIGDTPLQKPVSRQARSRFPSTCLKPTKQDKLTLPPTESLRLMTCVLGTTGLGHVIAWSK